MEILLHTRPTDMLHVNLNLNFNLKMSYFIKKCVLRTKVLRSKTLLPRILSISSFDFSAVSFDVLKCLRFVAIKRVND